MIKLLSRPRPAGALVSLGLAVGALALPAAAQARLTYQTCVRAPAETYTTCPTVASDNAIQTPDQITVSPDGATAYIAAESTDGRGNVGIFSTAGSLAQTGELPNASAVNAYGPPTSSAVSPDGNNLYVTSSDQLWTYTRSHTDGSLSSPSCIGAPSTTCPVQTPELTNPYRVVVSPDGNSVYVVNDDVWSPAVQSSVSEFSRNPATGALTYVGCLDTVAVGSCTVVSSNMLGLRQLVVTPDGHHAYGIAYPNGTHGAVIVLSRSTATGALTYANCYGESGGCTSIAPNSTTPLGLALSGDGTQLYVTHGNTASQNNISTYSLDSTTGALTFAGCIANGLPHCASSADQFYDSYQLVPSSDGRDLYVSDNGNGFSEYARDPATGVLHYVGCYAFVGAGASGPFFTTCTNTAPGLFFSQDFALTPDGTHLYAPSWGNNPWSAGSLGNYGGGVVDQFTRVADAVVATPPPAILTSSARLGGSGISFAELKKLKKHKKHRGLSGTITLMLNCPDGVTQYCSGKLAQVGNVATAITGQTDKHGHFSVRLRVHLTKAQAATLRRLGHVKITIAFVQHMPNGRNRTTHRTITIV